MDKKNQLTTDFHLREFKCKDGTEVPTNLFCNVVELATQLQIIRNDLNANRPKAAPAKVDIGISIISGYRTPTWNEKVGGKDHSFHLKAMAGDLTCKWESPKQLSARIKRLIKEKKIKQGGVGLYPGFVHYDVRGNAARW